MCLFEFVRICMYLYVISFIHSYFYVFLLLEYAFVGIWHKFVTFSTKRGAFESSEWLSKERPSQFNISKFTFVFFSAFFFFFFSFFYGLFAVIIFLSKWLSEEVFCM